MNPPPPLNDISPGLTGFITFALLSLVLWFLMRNMNSRLRRMSYREHDRELEREAAAGAQATSSPEARDAAPVAPAEPSQPAPPTSSD